MKHYSLLISLLFVAMSATAQIDKTGYTLVYSSETSEQASAELTLTDEEKANCSGDFMSTKNFERNWKYCPRQTSKWNCRMAQNDEDRAKVHVCEDGILKMYALSLDGTKDNCITSGIQMKQGYKYGIFEIKAKCNPHKSNFPAVWMMPSNPKGGWPNCGEIDIMEQIGTSSTVYSTVHLGARYGESVGKSYAWSGNKWFNNDYHIYSLHWTKTCLTFYCDGKEVFRYAKDKTLDLVNHPQYEHAQFPYNEEFYMILDQALGQNASWGNEDPDPSYRYEMDVQYVRIFQTDQEEEKLSYYLIQNAENPTYYMTATDKGFAGTEKVDASNPDPNSAFCFPQDDWGTQKYIRTMSGKYVATINITNKQVPFDDKGILYNVIKDEAKGVAFDAAKKEYPFTYSDGSRALILNAKKNNIISVSGTTKASAWWNLIKLDDGIISGITEIAAETQTPHVKKIVKNGQLLIKTNNREYTLTGCRLK